MWEQSPGAQSSSSTRHVATHIEQSVTHTHTKFIVAGKLISNKSDNSYLKTSWAFDILVHSRAFLEAILC